MYKINISQFSGPYDLLLQLIEKKDLDISEIALCEVTEQFLSYIETEEMVNSDELADFLVIASKLLYLKSKLLLPEVEEDEDPYDLEHHLKLYKSFIEAAGKISDILDQEMRAFPKDKVPVVIENKFMPPQGIDVKSLRDMFDQILIRIKPIVKLPQAIMEKTISLNEKILHIKNLISKHKEIGFDKILANSNNRSDVIVSFLALLELVNKKKVGIKQTKNFDNITIVDTSNL